MDKILNSGRYIFPLSFLLYVGLHLGKPEVGASFVPDFLPFPYFWNYFTLVCICLFIISAVVGKYDKLGYSLMALYVVLMAVLVHLPRAMGHSRQVEAQFLLKPLSPTPFPVGERGFCLSKIYFKSNIYSFSSKILNLLDGYAGNGA